MAGLPSTTVWPHLCPQLFETSVSPPGSEVVDRGGRPGHLACNPSLACLPQDPPPDLF